jgi:hypothetical protein
MHPEDPLSERSKNTKDKKEQGVNSPAMPVAWTREVANAAGTKNRVLTTTMGAATDLKDESLRRLLVNGVFWGLGLEVPAKADVTPLVQWTPSKYSNNMFHPGLKAEDFAVVLPPPLTVPTPSSKKKK